MGVGEAEPGEALTPRSGAGASVEAGARGGKYRSAGELAEAEGVTRSLNRLLRLTLLAPEIVDAILEGKQPKAMQLEELTGTPSEWKKAARKSLLMGPGPDLGTNCLPHLSSPAWQ